jgi:hypothetical protein
MMQCRSALALLLVTLLSSAAIAREVGSNDFRISSMGPDGDANFGPYLGSVAAADFTPSTAWNDQDDQYLVVWASDDDVEGEFEIFGQLLDGDGRSIGSDFRISDTGADGDSEHDALNPAVTWNGQEYLVVWDGDEADGELEIFGQRINAAGVEVGSNDFQITQTGIPGDVTVGAFRPAIAWNETNSQYLLVWHGDTNVQVGNRALVDGEFEIFGQRLSADAALAGNTFLISDMGSDGDRNFDAFDPAVAWNSDANRYLVVWHGDDNSDFGRGPLANDEFEIFGQLLRGATGAQIGADFRISDMSTDGMGGTVNAHTGHYRLSGTHPAVVYNARSNQYLVVWQGNDTPKLARNEFEIFGQRLSASGQEIGQNDFRISYMGPAGSGSYEARRPAVAFNPTYDEYLVVWDGDDDGDYGRGQLSEGEFEIFGQRLLPTGTRFGGDQRLSDMGPDGAVQFDAVNPMLAWNATRNEYLAVWRGVDDRFSLVEQEFEIFGQRFENEATVRFSQAIYDIRENAGRVTVVAERAGNTSEAVTVDYTTSDISAAAPSDYVAATGTLTFNPTITRQTIQVGIVDDSLVEPSETLRLVLSNASPNAIIDPDSKVATVTLTNDDSAGTGGDSGGGGGAMGLLFPLMLVAARALQVRRHRSSSS